MKLVVVESPAKAKTIERFLGSDYKVVASYGHIRDLPSSASEVPKAVKGKSWASLGVDPENEFAPVYVVPSNSKKRVTEIKKMLKDCEELLLATDEDREGESISWHLLEVLKPKIPVKRIAFHEITKSAIEEALSNPRDIDERLVKAQESRRILDRLYGYTLSPVLWKKVRTKLSAGRVQSVALRLIVDREEERQRFVSAEYWDMEALLTTDETEFSARLTSIDGTRLATGKDFDPENGELKDPSKVIWIRKKEAKSAADDCAENQPWKVTGVEKKRTKKSPLPPFTTSTLQQAAGSRLGMSTDRTMRTAQRLYEGIDIGSGDRLGLITYMRTDSVNLSEKAIHDLGTYIESEYGREYHKARRFKTKSKGAQEAHEAIRPTEVSLPPEKVKKFLDKDEFVLYTLIFNRAVASQMTEAETDKTAIDIVAKADDRSYNFRATGSVVVFPGFLKAYGNGGTDTFLPDLKEGDLIGGDDGVADITKVEAQKHETTPPPRYTEASLVKKLEEEGIGRPSTYAPTISTIQKREYVIKKSGSLIPTFIGMAVTRLLREHFPKYVDIGFTAEMEQELDDIAGGEVNPAEFLSEFYHGNGDSKGLLERIKEELPQIEYPEIPIGDDPETGKPINIRIGQNSVYIQRGEGGEGNTATISVDLQIDELSPEKASEIITERSKGSEPLGKDPETGENVYALVGPYGPYVQLGEANGKKKKPKRVSLPRGMKPDDVDFDYALKLLGLPRHVGDDPDTGEKVTAGVGRFGPYVERAGTYRSVDSYDQLFEISLEDAVKLLNEKPKRKQKKELREIGKHPESGETIKAMEGRYGPYITDGTVNASIPKAVNPDDITVEQAVAMLADSAAKKKTKKRSSGRRKKKK